MATLSSPGIGSGLDIKNIVSQLVALEKRPLDTLKLQAATVQTKISAFGQIKSLVSTLSDAAGKLTSVTGWNAVSTASSDSKFVSASAIGGTLPTSFSVEVQGLAKAQATASAALLPVGGGLGAGTLRLELGKWSVSPASFTPAAGIPVDIQVLATDTLGDVASKINGANAGVTASVLTDASGERLLLRGKNTGEKSGFRLSVFEGGDTNPLSAQNTDAIGLSRLVSGSSITQSAQNARATVNGIAVTSATNTFANTVSGVTFKAEQVTTSPIDITVTKDKSAVQKNIDDFVSAYNAINQLLQEATKYDSATKSGGLLQGDSTAITLQNSLRNALQSVTTGSSVYQRLADVGITQQRGGDLAVDSSKLSAAMDNMDELRNMFRSTRAGDAEGIAVRIKKVASDLLSSEGFFKTKDDVLKRSLERNAKEQTRVNEKASRVEAQLNAKYSALDAKISSLNALNAYIGQQVTTWNKSSR